MIMTAAIAVFLAGLMIGRTPEYLGKQIGPNENKMIVFYALTGPVTILILTAIAISTKAGLAGLTTNTGPLDLAWPFQRSCLPECLRGKRKDRNPVELCAPTHSHLAHC